MKNTVDGSRYMDKWELVEWLEGWLYTWSVTLTLGKALVESSFLAPFLQDCAKEWRSSVVFLLASATEVNEGQFESVSEHIDAAADDDAGWLAAFLRLVEVFGELEGDCLVDAATDCNEGKWLVLWKLKKKQ